MPTSPKWNHPFRKGKWPTPLSEWCRLNKTSIWKIALKTGADRAQMYTWAHGRVLPSIVWAARIEEATDGAVPIASWLGTELAKWHRQIIGQQTEEKARQKLLEAQRRFYARKKLTRRQEEKLHDQLHIGERVE